jgi:hypothetical protein
LVQSTFGGILSDSDTEFYKRLRKLEDAEKHGTSLDVTTGEYNPSNWSLDVTSGKYNPPDWKYDINTHEYVPPNWKKDIRTGKYHP